MRKTDQCSHLALSTLITLLLLSLILALVSCGGKASHRFGSPTESSSTDRSGETTDGAVAAGSKADGKSGASDRTSPDYQDFFDEMYATDSQSTQGSSAVINSDESLAESRYYGEVDVTDSASAVDDEIWRQLDLAEEYHAMGLLANREGIWEEAQYYFEKAIRVLAALDIEGDSLETPEAAKYTSILDNVIADYRMTMRSLGDLQEDVSASVLLERFLDVENRLGDDSLRVYEEEQHQITYDLPVVMNDRVKKSVIYFQTVAREAFTKYLTRSTRYKSMMLDIINQYGLPNDLIYLSLVESGYNPRAYSWARASGLWQFIASTGRMYDLDRSWWYDERRDPIKSTHAACRFLKDLYEEFGSWELAMAAYNGGPGRVRRTIKSQKTVDFWKMKLRRQTMDYIPLIYAAAIIAKDPEKYGFYDIQYEPSLEWDVVTIDRCLELSVVADEVGCSLEELKDLNPELLRKYTPPNNGNYLLKIPAGAKSRFLAAYDSMPSPKETSWVKHQIHRGETVSTIAARYGVSQYAILEANNLSRRSTIYAGRTLIVPVPLDREYGSSGGSYDKSSYTTRNSIYTVRAGDTMWDIAKAFGTSVDAIRRINYIERSSRIYVGQKLKIPSDATYLASTGDKGSSSPKTYGSPGTEKTYKVRSGDTLWDIARMFRTTTAKIRHLNGLGRSSRIYPGQLLVIDRGDDAHYVIHKVRRGETLSRIAQKYRTSISRIIQFNDIQDPDRLHVGDQLKIYTN